MENINLTIEEFNQTNADNHPMTQGQIVNIFSVCVPLRVPADDSFTIRGYVAEMKRKNPELCSPFGPVQTDEANSVDDQQRTPTRNLQPLCENCLHESGDESQILVGAEDSSDAGDERCSQPVPAVSAAKVLLEMQSVLAALAERDAEINPPQNETQTLVGFIAEHLMRHDAPSGDGQTRAPQSRKEPKKGDRGSRK